MRLIVLSAASLVALATPAFAQEEAEFDGPYIGVSVGYSFQPSDDDETILFDRDLDGNYSDTVVTSGGANAFSPGFCGGAATSTAPGTCTPDNNGISYNVRLGYDIQMGNIVIGAVAEAGKTDIRDSVSAFSTTPARYTMTREIDWNAGLRGRIGYTAGKGLLYATGGLAYARIDHSFSTSNTANSFTERGRNSAWGYSVGGGIEYKLSRNFSLGAEYLFTSLDDDDYRVRAGAGTAPPTNPFILSGAGGTDFQRSSGRFNSHGISATASFRF